MPLYLGNKLMSEEYLGSTNVSLEFKFPPIDIVRDGLLFAFDTYNYISGSNTLVDKSGNGYNATIIGNINIIDGLEMQFSGDTGSYLSFTTQSIYPPWQYTTQTYITIPDTLPTTTFMKIASGGGSWRWIIDPSGSGSLPNNLNWQSNLVTTTTNQLTSSITNTTLTATGTEIYSPFYSTGTGSFIEEYYNTVKLPLNGINSVPFRSFNWESTQMTFGKYDLQTFGPIVIEWAALTGSVKYIAYYDRPLTQVEITQNNEFYLSGNPIP